MYGVADAGLGAKVGFHYRTTPADPDAIDRDVGADEIETIRAILADRAIDGSTAHPIGMFDPTRFDPPHSRRR